MKREGAPKGERDQKLLNFFSLTYSQSCILRLMFTERINKRRLIGNIFPPLPSLFFTTFSFDKVSNGCNFLVFPSQWASSPPPYWSQFIYLFCQLFERLYFFQRANSAYFSSHSFFPKEFSFCKIVFSACVNFFQEAAFPFRIFSPFLQRFNYCITLPSLDSRIFQRTFCSSP